MYENASVLPHQCSPVILTPKPWEYGGSPLRPVLSCATTLQVSETAATHPNSTTIDSPRPNDFWIADPPTREKKKARGEKCRYRRTMILCKVLHSNSFVRPVPCRVIDPKLMAPLTSSCKTRVHEGRHRRMKKHASWKPSGNFSLTSLDITHSRSSDLSYFDILLRIRSL